MTFKPAIWRPIAIVLSIANLVSVAFATGPGEALHATIHAGLALAFGVWAQRLRPGASESDFPARLDALEGEVSQLRQELGEAQERLDFAERLLAQGPEGHRVSPER
jgi:hypothetical protein